MPPPRARPVEAVVDGQREAARLVHQVRPPRAQLQHVRREPRVADLHALRRRACRPRVGLLGERFARAQGTPCRVYMARSARTAWLVTGVKGAPGGLCVGVAQVRMLKPDCLAGHRGGGAGGGCLGVAQVRTLKPKMRK